MKNFNISASVTVPSGLKLDKILQMGLTALKQRLLPVLAFSTVFRDQVLQGTDIVRVPFIPLDLTASQDFDPDVGYGDLADGTMDTRPVTINKRKFQSLTWSSSELRRQPAIDFQGLIQQKANQLADDVLKDIWSVVLAATYTTTSISATPAASFDSDSLADLAGAATAARWPAAGRSVILDSTYHTNLLKDTAFKNAMAYSDNAAIRDAKIPRAMGFDIFEQPSLPANGENLTGAAMLRYAILVAFSPIEPAPEVRERMTDYRIVSDPDSGLSLEYRAWGDPDSDKA